MHDLEKFIRDVPDFPKAGIIFKDITPLLQAPAAFKQTLDLLESAARKINPDAILGIESRGFIFGGALADRMRKGLLVARKPGKLPYKTDKVSYQLEYGTNTLELHVDAVKVGQQVLVVDDLLATGGTAAACAQLIERQGGKVAGYSFVVELAFLKGREKLKPHPVSSILVY
jgi:adenine phosphoribosyltransferase